MADVELRDVSKSYGHVRALDHFSLTVRDHEMLVVVGPSGCGKSTTLRLIAGLETADSGSIHIGGRAVDRVPPKDRDVAMVFQNYALYPHMTVYQNLAFGLRMRGTGRAETDRRVQEVARTLAIEDLLHRRPSQLSGGQRQRVAVGRAIVRKPAVFLFDEPLSNLDAKLRVTTRGELVRLQRALQTTAIYVTHDQVEAMLMGDRVVVMDQGAIQQLGTPREIYERPATRFVAEFMGSPPMNMLAGRMHREGDAPVLKLAGDHIAWDSAAHGVVWQPGRAVDVGIRPEDITTEPPSRSGRPGWALAARVRARYHLGPDVLIELESPRLDRPLTMRAASRTEITTGETLTVHVAFEHMHLFDALTGVRCTESSTP